MGKYARTSYEKTEAAVIKAGACQLTAILIITDGTNPATVILYNKPSATGIDPANKIWEGSVPGASMYGGRNWTFPVFCNAGIYATVSGTGASYIVEYMDY